MLRLGFCLISMLAVAAGGAAGAPRVLNPKPILIAVQGAGEAEVAGVRTLLDGYFREGGWGGSSIPASAFSGCDAGEDRLACTRDRLRPLRVEAGEVAIAVLIAPDGPGGVEITCLGGSRRGAWLDEDAQIQRFSAAELADPASRTRAETCVGKAFGEYMVP